MVVDLTRPEVVGTTRPLTGGTSGGYLLQLLDSTSQETVAGRSVGADFVAAHNDVALILVGMLGQLLHSHVDRQ